MAIVSAPDVNVIVTSRYKRMNEGTGTRGEGIVRNSTSGTGCGTSVVVKANLGTRPNVSSSVKSMQREKGI